MKNNLYFYRDSLTKAVFLFWKSLYGILFTDYLYLMEENFKNREQLETPEARYNAMLAAERKSMVERGKTLSDKPYSWIKTIGLTLFSTLLVQGALRGEARADEIAVQKQIAKLAADSGVEKSPVKGVGFTPFALIEGALIDAAQEQIDSNKNDSEVDSIGKNKAKKLTTPGFGGEIFVAEGVQVRVSFAKESVDGKAGAGAYSLLTFDL